MRTLLSALYDQLSCRPTVSFSFKIFPRFSLGKIKNDLCLSEITSIALTAGD